MSQLVRHVLVGGLLASSAAASQRGPSSVGPDSTTHTSAATVQAHTASAVEPLTARVTNLAPPSATHRSIQGFQVPTHVPLPPAAAEPLAGLSSGSTCPPSASDLPCRAPY